MDQANPPDRVLYKLLGPRNRPAHGGAGRWGPPSETFSGEWIPGPWRTVRGPLEPCWNGLHLVDRLHVLDWLSDETVALYEAEWRGSLIDVGNKVVVRSARLLRPVLTFTIGNLRLAAADSAETALAAWEAYRPGDPSVRQAIEVVRRYASGLASEDELSAAESAARSAAESAWSAAESAARSAAWSAAESAARSAAWSAAEERLADRLELR